MSGLKNLCNNLNKIRSLSRVLKYSTVGFNKNHSNIFLNKFYIRQFNILKFSTISPNCSDLSNSNPSEPPQFPWKYFLIGMTFVGGIVFTFKEFLTDSNTTIKLKKPTKANKRTPESSVDIPDEVPYLLIGGGTASFSAFRAIKSHDPKAKVMVITNEYEMPYMRPPLSKELWFYNSNDAEDTKNLKFRQWNGVERSLYYEPNDFYVEPQKLNGSPNGGVAIVRGYTVKNIDVSKKIATLEDGKKISYGECLIATGSSPKNLDVILKSSEQVKEKISIFKTTEDFKQLRNIVNNVNSIAIIGGGFLGSELACALAKFKDKKINVYQLFYESGNMGKILPEYLSVWTTERVRDEGVIVLSKSEIKSVERIGNQIKLDLENGKYLLVDHAVVAIGSQPNTQLAEASKLEVDEKYGGFLVNAELEARRHVYAAGDVACFYDPTLGRRRVEHHDHAVVSGRLAGENMVGLKKPYTHQSMFWSDLGPLVGYEAIGLIDSCLPTVGVFAMPTEVNIYKSEKNDGTTNQIYIKKDSDNCGDIKKDDNMFGKGVVFYLRDGKIVGILLWNVFNRINIARKIISENKVFDDLNEVAKLFDIHTTSIS